MKIVHETSTRLELKADLRSIRRDIMAFWAIGIITPISGAGILFIRQDIAAIILGCFFLSGISFLIAGGTLETCTLDKMQNKIIFSRRAPLKTTLTEYWLHDIAKILIWHNTGEFTCSLILLFTSGKRKELYGFESEESARATAGRIEAFLLNK